MKITLAAIGKAKAGPERTLYEHYAKRLPWPVSLKECEDKKSGGGVAERKAREALLLLAATEGCDVRVALDEKGSSLTSAAFAAFLQTCKDGGEAHIAFMIGGADGLDASIFPHCRLRLNLGQMTWPHMLVRGLLAEQLYRAFTIQSGHPYHRE